MSALPLVSLPLARSVKMDPLVLKVAQPLVLVRTLSHSRA